jgi:N-acetylmuramoyl-L-alanine amidase
METPAFGRPASALLALLLVLGLVAAGSGIATAAAPAGNAVLTVSGSPFDSDGDGRRERVGIRLGLRRDAIVEAWITDFDGRRKKTLQARRRLDAGRHTWSWKGRDGRGRKLAPGPYRVKVEVRTAGRSVVLKRWVTQARRVPYAIRPGAIVVALDAGHGGPAAGAVWRGLREDAVNLDITRRLEAMLRGAGVRVVMTRRADRNVSPRGLDISGDGRYSRLDELIARNDVANLARADIHLALHNNASPCHCTRGTEMYTHAGRGWSPEGKLLARLILDEHVKHLRRVPGYLPRNRGVRFHHFKALKPYHRERMRRPSLQPSVLGESLFLDRPSEHRILSGRWGRNIIAAAYFDGVARYLGQRKYGLRYEVLEAPRVAIRGRRVGVNVRLTNTGHRTSKSWRLVARVAPKVFRYDGRPRRGAIVARVSVPDGLRPGQSTVVKLRGIPTPTRTGRWLLKLDVNLPHGDTLSRHGVVGPQLHFKTMRR